MRPTDREIATMLRNMAWAMVATGPTWTPEKKRECADAMSAMATAIVGPVDMMAGAAEYYRPGVYNGD